MKYKYCPDCGSKMTHSRSSCGWAESYNCDMGCHLQIEIRHGETMHAVPDEEKWIRKQPEPRKPREWSVHVTNNEMLTSYPVVETAIKETIRVREIIND